MKVVLVDDNPLFNFISSKTMTSAGFSDQITEFISCTKALKYLREAWGDGATPLTQEAAAEKFGVSTRTWAGWELGTHTPPVPSGKLIDLYFANPNLQ